MAGLFRIFVVFVLIGTTPGTAMANAVVPWFSPENTGQASLSSPKPETSHQLSPDATATPKKRLLAMSIGNKRVQKHTVHKLSATQSSAAGGPLALLVSLAGLILIGALIRIHPEAKSDKRI